ncbi:pyridoxal 5'-phosphate synthase [Streptomyces sp. H10-C2]|uniref:pyridoxine/pyridoxamine 5'-phosphate oxidase n=1 Tax=unclassified Streptomyces TaxID=2593676 RepID=UPI0024BA987A|nr:MULTISPECIES: pyridoxal 5'-phosphate synthase [unclassified Streptomyces]MDJ0344172.1 pyridoxal 5'-phosphate synthase [Streptomyces sp. PH10-H1]MDJ0373069.1 pyridoxal 5'-phosphate synthase [Streptomyces sp. H10-C2]
MAEIRQLLRELEVFAGDLPPFDPGDTPDDPAALFTEWLLEAIRSGVPEPHAMTLSTAGADGDPSARVLILKNLDRTGDRAGWQFATHSGSGKGQDLAERPYAALTFYWPAQARQIRVRGPVTRESADLGAADFLARGASARAEALLGRTSRPLTAPADRDAALRESQARLEREPDLVAPEWTLYSVQAEQAEFWQGDKHRNHTRLNYRRSTDGWHKELLWP